MQPPSVYLFYGDDPLNLRQAVDSLRDRLGDSADLNLQRFNANTLDLNQLAAACQALPFLAERRVVIIENAERLAGGTDFRRGLEQLLESLPPSTALVFAAALEPGNRSAEKDFQKRSPILDWTNAHPDVSYVRRFARLTGAAFARWLIDHAAERKATLEPQAAELLAALVDEDPLLAEQELSKLVDYAGEQGAITAASIEKLTPMYGQTDIFEVVDGLGRGGESLLKLHRLLQEQDPAYVFLMVVRQFRLLLQARQALDDGQDPGQVLGVPAFVARKVASQATSFTLQALESFYHQLVALDVAVKRGEANLELDLVPVLASFSPVMNSA
jgi:DNA polymerase-3 subunit delta